jgi:hypothetical protein
VVDFDQKLGEQQMAEFRNLLEAVPERILEADAGFMSSDHDESFDDWRFDDWRFHARLLAPASSVNSMIGAGSRRVLGTRKANADAL